MCVAVHLVLMFISHQPPPTLGILKLDLGAVRGPSGEAP